MRSTVALCAFAVMTTVATWSPATASAQVIELTPFVGGFFPVGDFVDEDEFLGKHQTALAAGVRLAYQSAGRVGFAAGATYAASDFEVDDGGFTSAASGHVLTLSGTARYTLSAPQSRIQTHQASRARLQNDIMLSVGVAIPVSGRR